MISEKFSELYSSSFLSAYVRTIKSLNRWTYLLLLVACASALILYIDNVKHIDTQLQILEKKQEKLRETISHNKLLHAKYIELQSPDRIDRIARETLGMIVPNEAPKKIIVKR